MANDNNKDKPVRDGSTPAPGSSAPVTVTQDKVDADKAAEKKAAEDKAEAERIGKDKEAADKAAKENSDKLSAKFGGDQRAAERKIAEDRIVAIKKLLRDSIRPIEKNVKPHEGEQDLEEFSLALQEKRADLPNKAHLTVEEFNDFMNELNAILAERDSAAQSSADTMRYVIGKIRSDSVA